MSEWIVFKRYNEFSFFKEKALIKSNFTAFPGEFQTVKKKTVRAETRPFLLRSIRIRRLIMLKGVFTWTITWCKWNNTGNFENMEFPPSNH